MDTKPRYYYLDNLKVALTVLVIFHHGGGAYGDGGAAGTHGTVLYIVGLGFTNRFCACSCVTGWFGYSESSFTTPANFLRGARHRPLARTSSIYP